MESARGAREAVSRPDPDRKWRRRLVACTYLGYVATAAVWALGERFEPGWGWSSLFPLLFALVAIGGAFVLRESVRRTADLPDEQLDERQRAVRDRAYLAAYRIVATAFFLAAVYGAIAHDSGLLWLPDTWAATQAVVWAIFLLVVSLPSAVVAWTEPDAPGEEEA